MSEIKCYEKVYFPEGEGSGHTWNTFFADGVWMNADATNGCADAELNADEINKARRWFGFSDTRQKHIPLYSDKLQKCETDLLPLACDFEKGTSKSVMAQSVKKAFENTDKNYILVKFPEPKISKDVLISFANALMHKIGSSHVESQDEGLYVLIYKIK